MKECAKCGVVSADNSERCDCGYVFSGDLTKSSNPATKRAIQAVIKIVAGIAAVGWFLAPVTRYPGILIFVIATAVLLACFAGLRFLDDDWVNGWWPRERNSNR